MLNGNSSSLRSAQRASRTERKPAVRWGKVLAVCAVLVCGVAVATATWSSGCFAILLGDHRLWGPNPDCTAYRQGVAALDHGDYETAISQLTWALEDNPQDADAWAARGDAYYTLGQLEAALHDYSKAIEIDPDGEITTYSSRAYVLARLDRDLDQALADVNRVLQAYPERGDYLDTRAFVYYERGEYAVALRDAELALQRGEVFAAYTLGLTYEATGQAQSAINYYRRFITATQHPDSTQARDARTRILALGGTPP